MIDKLLDDCGLRRKDFLQIYPDHQLSPLVITIPSVCICFNGEPDVMQQNFLKGCNELKNK
jgi:hypothetical protein